MVSTVIYAKIKGNDDRINIIKHKQQQSLNSGVTFDESISNVEYVYNASANEYIENANLNDFHTYALVVNETHIQWLFDGHNYMSINDVKKLKLYDKPFTLYVLLDVHGNKTLTSKDILLPYDEIKRWNCPALIIDYIRVYEWTDSPVDVYPDTNRNVSRDGICADIMSDPKCKFN